MVVVIYLIFICSRHKRAHGVGGKWSGHETECQEISVEILNYPTLTKALTNICHVQFYSRPRPDPTTLTFATMTAPRGFAVTQKGKRRGKIKLRKESSDINIYKWLLESFRLAF